MMQVAHPLVFNGFGVMAVQLHRREISLKNAKLTLEIMDSGNDEMLRNHISVALAKSKSKKELAKALESIQDYMIMNIDLKLQV